MTTPDCDCPRNEERTLWDLKWKELSYRVPVKEESENPIRGIFKKSKWRWKQVLKNLSGEVKRGEVVAILGPSGAGKSSLLNVLAGRLSGGEPSGEITINGKPRADDWNKIAAYVEQADIMYPTLTVRETVAFAAQLRLPRSYTTQQKMGCVDEVLKVLGLQHVCDTRIGDSEHRGVSGGEKKRVSIAVELVTDPGLLFLDEPTSGLDAFTAQTVCQKVADLAKVENRTVLLTIHQPRLQILEMFTKIILVSQGSIVFFGSVHEALRHMEDHGFKCPNLENPADFFLDTITIDRRAEDAQVRSTARVEKLINVWGGEEGTRAAEAAEPQSGGVKFIKPRNSFNALIITELGLIMKRYFRIQLRDLPTLLGTIFQTIAMSLMLAFVFFQLPKDDFASVQSRVGLCAFLPVTLLFTIMIPLINAFTKDRDIILKERYSGTYRIFSAYTAKFLSLLPLQFALTTFFSFVIYYITGLRTDGFQYFLIFYGFLLLMALASITMGLMVGAVVPNAGIGALLGPMLVAMSYIFGGSLANNDQVTWILRWLQYLSPIFFCFSALIQNELQGQTFGQVSGDTYIDLYAFNQVSILWCMGGLMMLSLAFYILGYLAIRRSTRPKIILI